MIIYNTKVTTIYLHEEMTEEGRRIKVNSLPMPKYVKRGMLYVR